MNDSEDKIPVISFDFNLKSRSVENKHESFLYKDEESDCENFVNMDGSGCINYCLGNEPYSCHRSKKEGLCHKEKKQHETHENQKGNTEKNG